MQVLAAFSAMKAPVARPSPGCDAPNLACLGLGKMGGRCLLGRWWEGSWSCHQPQVASVFTGSVLALASATDGLGATRAEGYIPMQGASDMACPAPVSCSQLRQSWMREETRW